MTPHTRLDAEGEAMDALVSTDWLSAQLDAPDLVVLDCSVYQEPSEDGGFHNESGRVRYEAGHIPGAGFADLKDELADSQAAIEFALPSPEAFCTAMGKLGVGDDTRVVLYDASYSAWAARVWWMLRWVGFDRAAILDGGLKAWTEEGRPLEAGPVEHPPRTLTPAPRPRLIADRDEVRAAINDARVQLIDTLPPNLYRGEQQLYARPGHIPTAKNIFGIELLDETGHHCPLEQAEKLHQGNKQARHITYCGGGILASLNAFVMTRLGYTDVAVYTASLQEWAADPKNPMVTEPSEYPG